LAGVFTRAGKAALLSGSASILASPDVTLQSALVSHYNRQHRESVLPLVLWKRHYCTHPRTVRTGRLWSLAEVLKFSSKSCESGDASENKALRRL
jgi:hypothetical protein